MVRQAHHERAGTAMNGDNQPLTLSLSKGWCLSLAMVMALSLLALLMFPKPAHACMCGPSGAPRDAMAKADAVFAGQVVAINEPGPYLRNGQMVIGSADLVKVEFNVGRVWKGPRPETITVETERMGISCGYEFKEGRRYIVYAWGGNRTGLCTRTAPVWLAARDFAALGLGERPEPARVTPSISKPVDMPASGNNPRGNSCGAAPTTGGIPVAFVSLGSLAGMAWLLARRK